MRSTNGNKSRESSRRKMLAIVGACVCVVVAAALTWSLGVRVTGWLTPKKIDWSKVPAAIEVPIDNVAAITSGEGNARDFLESIRNRSDYVSPGNQRVQSELRQLAELAERQQIISTTNRSARRGTSVAIDEQTSQQQSHIPVATNIPVGNRQEHNPSSANAELASNNSDSPKPEVPNSRQVSWQQPTGDITQDNPVSQVSPDATPPMKTVRPWQAKKDSAPVDETNSTPVRTNGPFQFPRPNAAPEPEQVPISIPGGKKPNKESTGVSKTSLTENYVKTFRDQPEVLAAPTIAKRPDRTESPKSLDSTPVDAESNGREVPLTTVKETGSDVPVESNLYVVTDQDSFWTISQAIYGDGRYFGMLFRENITTCPNYDGLVPGMKLKCPPLKELLARNAGTDSNRDSLSSKTNAKRNADRMHVTLAGDTLFDIARQQLGQASRYIEIMDMNSEILNQSMGHLEPLPAGLKLRLPK